MIPPPIEKVTAFVTRVFNSEPQIAVFRHEVPEGGIQLPAGTVEVGEDVRSACLREVAEEVALYEVQITEKLGREIFPVRKDHVRILWDSALQLYPMPQSTLLHETVSRRDTVRLLSMSGDFVEVMTRTGEIGWVPKKHIDYRIIRHYFHLHFIGHNTPKEWTTQTDGWTFTCFWLPLEPWQNILHPAQQKAWLNPRYELIRDLALSPLQ